MTSPATAHDATTHSTGPVRIAHTPGELAPAVIIDATTIAPSRRGQNTYVPPLCDTTGVTITQAIANLRARLSTVNLRPEGCPDLDTALTQIDAWALTRNINLLVELSGDTAARLIADLAGVPDLSFTRRTPKRGEPDTTNQTATARHRAHQVRNTITALRIASTSGRDFKNRRMEDHYDVGLPVLPARYDSPNRAATDDETLLMRLACIRDFLEGAPVRPLAARVLVETGIPVAHATTLTRDRLDDSNAPTRVTVPAHGGKTVFDPVTGITTPAADRDLPLTGFASQILERILQILPPHGDTNLTYTGDSPGENAASASLSGQLARHIRRAGLHDPDLTPRSLSRWRAKHALVHGDPFQDALLYLGGSSKNLLTNLKLARVTQDTDRKNVWLTETHDAPREFKIAKRDFNSDRALTRKRLDVPAGRSWDLTANNAEVIHTTTEREIVRREIGLDPAVDSPASHSPKLAHV